VRAAQARRLPLAGAGVLSVLIALPLALPPYDVSAYAVLPIAISFGAVGTLVSYRRPHNPVGWLLLCFGLVAGINAAGTQWAYHTLVSDPGSLPAGDLAASIAVHLWHPGFTFLTLAFLLLPDGRLPSRRWRPFCAVAVAVSLVALPFGMLEREFLHQQLSFVDPGEPSAVSDLAAVVFGIAVMASAAALLVSMLGLVYRLAKAKGEERLRLKWVVYAVVVAVAVLPLSVLLLGDGRLFVLAIPLVPASVAIAIFRYRLFDIDVIVNRSLVYGALTLFVLAVYAALVAVTESTLSGRTGVWTSILAAGLVAVGVSPLRDRLQRAVDRLLYGDRREPYRVLSRLGARLEATIAPEDVASSIVETIAQALRLPYVAVVSDGRVEAVHGVHDGREERVPLTDRGEVVGELVLGPRPGEDSFGPVDRALLEDLARQAGVAWHAVSLTRALQRSRERLVTAREEERRRLRRDLHDGVGPTLAAITLELDAARGFLADDPDRSSELLAELRRQTQAVIGDIRRLAHDLRPPALDELGLVEAVREQAARIHNGTRVDIDAPAELPPLPAAVEVAAYRIALEALTNVVRHANASTCTVRVAVNGGLEIEVSDDGTGLAPNRRAGVGMSSMRERAAELGGTCTVEPNGRRGTRVLARLPLHETAPAG
jgi:two-component system NarL family sensor kinase